jgi:hypothetical protein
MVLGGASCAGASLLSRLTIDTQHVCACSAEATGSIKVTEQESGQVSVLANLFVLVNAVGCLLEIVALLYVELAA